MKPTDAYSGRNAFVFAATGAIAGAVAIALARRGANLFLSARNLPQLKDLAAEIESRTGVAAEIAEVDAESRTEVAGYLVRLEKQGISPDWVFNGIGVDPVSAMYGMPSEIIGLAAFCQPLVRIVGSQFVTATTAAAAMRRYSGGTVVLLTASLSKSAMPYMAGVTAASDAVEGLARVLDAEYGVLGVRVCCVRVAGIPETRTIRLTSEANARTMGLTAEEFGAHALGHGAALSLGAAATKILDATEPGGDGPVGEPMDIAA